ncbi:SDR family oxidoreductase [Patulibacter brassicae]|uniref:Peroxisomal trans-2-enoyl-CoA reductase n=1 Tax=Patulibacter brassicae TaxID=1705717 RepID=A0ABU4VE93_9ACTN|nr:SDR family oxidoreductase [Patulibacter brassicae]MDX8150118.1 SDR family oxidoreductase [Patulibacter brassicae]
MVAPSRIFAPDLLAGQVIVVSGGGTGLGRAAALELVALGAEVVVCGRRPEPLEETVALAGERCRARVCDIREEDDVAAFVDWTLEQHGRIDTLLNNAGGQFLAPAESITPKGFRTVTRLNLDGTWLMTHAVATKAFIPAGEDGRARGGKVISVTLSPHNGLPGMVHSSAARAGVETMMAELSTEWARFGIRCNAIAAGQFGTEVFMTKYPQEMVAAAAGQVPLGRLGRPEEFAWLVAYLASPAGDWFSGATLTLDGGRDHHVGPWPIEGSRDAEGRPLQEARRA